MSRVGGACSTPQTSPPRVLFSFMQALQRHALQHPFTSHRGNKTARASRTCTDRRRPDAKISQRPLVTLQCNDVANRSSEVKGSVLIQPRDRPRAAGCIGLVACADLRNDGQVARAGAVRSRVSVLETLVTSCYENGQNQLIATSRSHPLRTCSPCPTRNLLYPSIHHHHATWVDPRLSV
jgi:hypothetical protein